jgi:hypothetical protein
MFDNLALKTASPNAGRQDAERESQRRRGQSGPRTKTLWQDGQDRRFTSFVITEGHLLAAGHPDNDPSAAFLAAIRIREGTDAWLHSLPANAVKGGTAMDPTGRILVALENGQLLCFAPDAG